MGSGNKTFLAGEALTASDLNNYVEEQVVRYFASTAARDSAITSPEAGAVAYIDSNDANEGLYVYDGSTWRKGPSWNAPWGLIIADASTASQLGIATTGAITDLSCVFTAVQNRYYKVSAFAALQNPSANLNCSLVIRKGGVAQVNISQVRLETTVNTKQTPSGWWVDTPVAGSTTYDLSVTLSTGTVDFRADTGGGALMVEDIGPAGAPP